MAVGRARANSQPRIDVPVLRGAPVVAPCARRRAVSSIPGRRLVCVALSPCIDRLAEVEDLRVGEINRPRSVVAVPGGKGLNVARAAATLGALVTATGFLAGHAGRWIAETLGRYPLRAAFVWVQGETRTCLSVHDLADGRLTEFYEPATPVGSADWPALEAIVRTELTEASFLTVSGSLPPGSPPDGVARLCRLARETGAPAILDTYGTALERALPGRPWLVKVNAAEAGVTGRLDVEELALEAASLLVKRGAQNALVTIGRAGAVIAGEEGRWRIGPPSESGPYPVGSGDAFLAGLATALLAGGDLARAALRGAAAAAANALRPGAGELDPLDAARLLPRIAIERVTSGSAGSRAPGAEGSP